jgi:hypothetical protein
MEDARRRRIEQLAGRLQVLTAADIEKLQAATCALEALERVADE